MVKNRKFRVQFDAQERTSAGFLFSWSRFIAWLSRGAGLFLKHESHESCPRTGCSAVSETITCVSDSPADHPIQTVVTVPKFALGQAFVAERPLVGRGYQDFPVIEAVSQVEREKARPPTSRVNGFPHMWHATFTPYS